MTAILADFESFAGTPAPRTASALQLPAASGMGRAFLIVQFAPGVTDVSCDTDDLARATLSNDADVQAFVAELRELGGMAVIA